MGVKSTYGERAEKDSPVIVFNKICATFATFTAPETASFGPFPGIRQPGPAAAPGGKHTKQTGMDILFLLIGLAAGFGLGFLFFKWRGGNGTAVDTSQIQMLASENSLLKIECGRTEERARHLQADLASTAGNWEAERGRVIQLTNELSASRTGNENLLQRLNEQKQEVEQLQEKFRTEFKNIANELLEDKSRRFTAHNQEKLGEILKPLNERIKSSGFEAKLAVGDAMRVEVGDRE